MATEVGTAYVAIIPSAKGFARSLQKEIAKEFAGSNLDKMIAEHLGNVQVKLPVEPVLTKDTIDTSGLRRPVTLPVRAEIDDRETAREVRQAVRVAERAAPTIELKVDVDRDRFGSAMGRIFDGAMDVLSGLAANAVKSLNQLASNFATNVVAGFSTVATTGTATTVATGGLNLLVGALLVAVGVAAVAATGFIALAPAVLIAGGAFGSAATAAVGLGGAFAVLKLGMSGIGDALKEIGKDGKVSEETLARLSPNARALVKELERLKGPLDNLRRFVQDRLLAGMNKEIRDLAGKWLPALKPMLGDLADRFNNFAGKVFQALGKPEFIKNIQSAMSGFGDAVDRVGESMPGLIDAFGRLAKASKPFLKELGDIFGDVVDKFSAWIAAADKTGKLDQFMKDAAKALRDIWDIGGLVFGIIGDIIEILFPTSKEVSGGFLGGVKTMLQDIKDWLGDPENQQKLKDFIDKIQEFVTKAVTEWIPKTIDFMAKVDGWVKKVEEWGATIQRWKDTVSTAFALVGAAVGAAMGRVRTALATAGQSVTTALGHFNRLQAGISERARSVVSTMQGLPGRIRSALGNTGSLLYQAGRNVIQGLIDGIRSRFGGLGSAIGAAAGLIRNHLPFSPAKMGPLSGRGNPFYSGQSIVNLLSSGVTSSLGVAQAAASDLAGTFALGGSPLAAAPAGGYGLSTAAPAPAPLVAEWIGGDGDPIIRAIREHTRIYYSGSPQAAFGS